MTFNDWEKDTPPAVRLLILEASDWPRAFVASSGEDLQKLLAARMQNLYLLGVNDGIKQGSDAALDTVKRVGKIV